MAKSGTPKQLKGGLTPGARAFNYIRGFVVDHPYKPSDKSYNERYDYKDLDAERISPYHKFQRWARGVVAMLIDETPSERKAREEQIKLQNEQTQESDEQLAGYDLDLSSPSSHQIVGHQAVLFAKQASDLDW